MLFVSLLLYDYYFGTGKAKLGFGAQIGDVVRWRRHCRCDVTRVVQIAGLGDCKLSWLHHPMEKGSQSNVTVRIFCPLSSLPGLDLIVLGIGR